MRESRRWLAYIAAGLFCFLVFLSVTLPAYWVDWLLQRASQDNVRIQEPTGTVWNGTGHLILRSLGQQVMQSKIAWSIQPLWLFTGKLGIRITARDSGAPLNATLRLGYRHLSIHAVDATLPAGAMSAFNPAVGFVAPTGRLQIISEQATLTPAGLDGNLQLTWLGAGAQMSGLSELGDYRLAVTGRGATVELRVDTLRGDVGVTAQGEWRTQDTGALTLTGGITPGNREQALRPLLTMLNVQNINGQYRWALNSHFSTAKLFGATP